MANSPKYPSWLASVSAHSFEGPNGDGPLRTVVARGRAQTDRTHHFKLDMNARNMDEAMRCCKCGRAMGTKEECDDPDQPKGDTTDG